MRLLLIEDNEDDYILLSETLIEAESQVEIAWCDTLHAGLAYLQGHPVDVILLDMGLPDSHGLATFDRVQLLFPALPIVIISGNDSDEQAIEAVRRGAQDYLVKGQINRSLLIRALHYAQERKMIQEALRHTENRYRNVVEEQTDLICRYNRTFCITFVNKAYSTWYGKEPDEMIGLNLFDLIPPELHAEVSTQLALLSDTTPILTNAYYSKHANGQYRWIQWTDQAMVDAQGCISEYQSVGRDITELHQLEEALRASEKENRQYAQALEQRVVERTTELNRAYSELAANEEELAHLVELQRAIVQSTDLAIITTSPHGLVQSFNPAAEKMLGYQSTEVINQLTAEQFHDVAEITARAAQIAMELDEPIAVGFTTFIARSKRGLPNTDEWHYRRKDGSFVPVLLTTSALRNRHGRVTGYVGIATDITERKRIEDDLRQLNDALTVANVELQQAARLKDAFLANMSHELRTPLNAILGRVEALQEHIYGVINERQQHALQSIQDSAHHLLKLINDLLDLAKIEAGKLGLVMSDSAIDQLCATSLQMVSQLAQAKRLQITSTLHTAASTIRADERRLKQILVNLLSNAVKFTPEGGMIGLEVTDDPLQQLVHFCVWDTGIGIADHEREQLFKPFVQVDSSLARQHEGTGLGLALVEHLTHMHHGTIRLESQPGLGSRFTVSLPCTIPNEVPIFALPTPQPRGTAVPEDTQATTQAPVVLLADDNTQTIDLLRDYLEMHGYTIHVAMNGYEAVQKAVQLKPAMILMDIQMPGMDGLEAIQHIRNETTLAEVPIIAVTALAMLGDREACLAAGANSYLAKPVSLRELVVEMERLMPSHSKVAQC